MDGQPRKKSPRAPSLSLQEAIQGALAVYERERRHAVPTDVVAQNLGYKDASNGSAIQALASLRYYGLLERSSEEGKVSVPKDVEAFRYAPNEELKQELQVKWLKSPPIFAELLERYSDGLPSDATLRFDLIQRGFTPGTAESVIKIFRSSVDFAKYFEERTEIPESAPTHPITENPPPSPVGSQSLPAQVVNTSTDHDRIPVRLSGGRRAWLEIPTPFYSADKKILKAQIDLLLTEEDEGSAV